LVIENLVRFMDALRAELRIWDCVHSERFDEFEIGVDPTKLFSRISRSRLGRLSIGANRKMKIHAPEGSMIEREFAAIRIAVVDRSAFDNVVMAEAGETELLGSHSLNAFGLAVDPIGKHLCQW
jgi:hypothetical protein